MSQYGTALFHCDVVLGQNDRTNMSIKGSTFNSSGYKTNQASSACVVAHCVAEKMHFCLSSTELRNKAQCVKLF